MAEILKCPDCMTILLAPGNCPVCSDRKKTLPKTKSVSGCQFCGAKVVWRNESFSVCLKHYEEKIYPNVVVDKGTIDFQKRLREVEAWIAKHPEFKTKREACLAALRARGKMHMLPESLHV